MSGLAASTPAWPSGVVADVGAALASCAGDVRPLSGAEWSIGDGACRVSARIDGGWLVLRRPFDAAVDGADVSPPALLRRSAGFAGGAKFSLGARLQVGAEVPLDGDVEARLREACGALGAADAGREQAVTAGDESPTTSGDADRLQHLCGEAGWGFTARPDGSLAVDLRVSDSYALAGIAAFPSGAVRVSVDVTGDGGAGDASPCRQALAIFALRVNDVVRLARAVLSGPANETHLRLEVVFGTQPTATELDHALAALSAAWSLCGREAEALLRDEQIARVYLEHGAPPPAPVP
jgi:hypothetical protein